MANKIRIDTRLLDVNWTTGTTYKLAIGAGLVREVGNNRSFSPAQATTSTTSTVFSAKTFTTFDSGPTITAVTPALNTTESFATTATITFNRTIYENATPSEFYLYKEVSGGTDELVSVLTTASSRVTRVGNTATIDLKNLVDSSSTYYLQSSAQPIYVDMFKFPHEPLTENKFKYSTGRPDIEFVTPPLNTTESFVTTAIIGYDRNIKLRSGNIRLYKETAGSPELIATLSTTSNRVEVQIDQIVINLKDLVDGNGTYYLESDYGFVDDFVANFRGESLTDEKFRYTTGRPDIDDVTPDYLTTGSFATTAVISFDRNIKTRSGNFYLYKVVNGVNTIVETLPIDDPRVTVSGDQVSIDLRYLLNGNSTYYLVSDITALDDVETNFKAEQITEDNFKYSTGPGPSPTAVTPTYGSTGTFVSTATITFNKNISLYDNNFYLYNDAGAYRTIPINSSSLRIVNGNKVEVTLYNEPIPEDTYWIGYDLGTVIDSNTFSVEPVTNDSLIKWTSLSLDNVKDLTYNSRIVNDFFEGNKPVIIDQDPNPMKGYRITLTASSGTFSAPFGFYDGDTWKYDSSREDLNDLFDEIQFEADVKDMNWDLAYNITLEKDDFEIVNRTKVMVGLPYDLENFQLVSNTFTNVVSSSTVLTVNANTSSPVSGLVTFRTTATVLGTSTFSANAASFSVPPNTLSLGTSSIYATWNGQIIVPKFNAAESNTIAQKTVPVGVTTSTMTLSPTEFYYHNINGTTASNVAAAVKINNIYRTHEPLGQVQLFDGTTLLASGNLTQGSNSSSVTINWNPLLFSQIDSGNKTISAVYAGDYWNQSTTTSAAFVARTRRSPEISLNPSVPQTGRYPFTLTATLNSSNYHNGQSLSFFYDGVFIGTSTVSGNSASVTIDPFNPPFPFSYAPGGHNFTANLSQTFAYTSATSNLGFEYIEPLESNLQIHSLLPQPFRKYNMTRVENTFVYSTLTMTASSIATDGVFTGTITLLDGVTVLTATTFASTGTSIGKKYVFWNPIEKGQGDQGTRQVSVQYNGDNYHYPADAYSSITAYSKGLLNTSSFVTNAYTAEGFASTETKVTVQIGTVDPRKNANNYVEVYHRPTSSERTAGYCYVYIDSVFPYPQGLPDRSRLDVFINEEFVEFSTEITPNNRVSLDQDNNRVRVPVTTGTEVIKVLYTAVGQNGTISYTSDKYSMTDGTIKFYDGVISTATLLATTSSVLAGYYGPNNRPYGIATATVVLSTGSHNIITVLDNDTYFENYQDQHNVVKYNVDEDWEVSLAWDGSSFDISLNSNNLGAIPEELRGPACFQSRFYRRFLIGSTSTTTSIAIVGDSHDAHGGGNSYQTDLQIAAAVGTGDSVPLTFNTDGSNLYKITNTNEFLSSGNYWYDPTRGFDQIDGQGTVVPWYEQNFWFVYYYFGNTNGSFPNTIPAKAFPNPFMISGYVDGLGNLVLDQSFAEFIYPNFPYIE
jgi:hypothetical protein